MISISLAPCCPSPASRRRPVECLVPNRGGRRLRCGPGAGPHGLEAHLHPDVRWPEAPLLVEPMCVGEFNPSGRRGRKAAPPRSGVELPREEDRGFCKISLSSSSRRTFAFNALISPSSSLVVPGRCPPSTWACTTQRRTDSFPTPSWRPTTSPAAQHPSPNHTPPPHENRGPPTHNFIRSTGNPRHPTPLERLGPVEVPVTCHAASM